MSRGIQIADAMVAHLVGQMFTPTITASRASMPVFYEEAIDSCHVVVTPGAEQRTRLSRSAVFLKTVAVYVVIRGPVANDANAAVDPMVDLVESIADALATVGAFAGYAMTGIARAQLAVPEVLMEHGVFHTTLDCAFSLG